MTQSGHEELSAADRCNARRGGIFLSVLGRSGSLIWAARRASEHDYGRKRDNIRDKLESRRPIGIANENVQHATDNARIGK